MYNFENAEIVREFRREKFDFNEFGWYYNVIALDADTAKFNDFVTALETFAEVFIRYTQV